MVHSDSNEFRCSMDKRCLLCVHSPLRIPHKDGWSMCSVGVVVPIEILKFFLTLRF